MPLTMNVRKKSLCKRLLLFRRSLLSLCLTFVKTRVSDSYCQKDTLPVTASEKFSFYKIIFHFEKNDYSETLKVEVWPLWDHWAIVPCAKTNKNTLKKKLVSFLFSGRKSWFSRRNLPNGLRGLKWQRKRSLIEIIILGPESSSL